LQVVNNSESQVTKTAIGGKDDQIDEKNTNLLQLKRIKVRPPDGSTFFGSLPLPYVRNNSSRIEGGRVKIEKKNKIGFLT